MVAEVQSASQVCLILLTLNLAFTGIHALFPVVEAAESYVHTPAAS